MKFQVKAQGFDKFVKKLKKLDSHLQTKVARRATARAADAVREQIKSRIPRAENAYVYYPGGSGSPVIRYPGDLAQAVINKFLPAQERPGKWSAHKITFAKNAKPVFGYGIGNVAHLIEGGVSAHAITRNGKTWQHPGHAAKPFMQAAIDASRHEVRKVIAYTVKNGIREYWDISTHSR